MSKILSLKDIKKKVNTDEFILNYLNSLKISDPFESYFINVEKLANGEYNDNYILYISINMNKIIINDKVVFRINYGSQMNLPNQIEYEYLTLKYLSDSKVTPKVILYDTSKKIFDVDYLLMEYIEGRWLKYEKDMDLAFKSLTEIHTYNYFNSKDKYYNLFLKPNYPMKMILDECISMYSKYKNSMFFDIELDKKMNIIFNSVEKIVTRENNMSKKINIEYVLINTELNSSNFLVSNNDCYIIDWEKAIWGEKEQDLGHFLAPTTTFWKTDILFSKKQTETYLKKYYDIYINKITELINISTFYSENIQKLDFENNFSVFLKKTNEYIRCNCLRGLSWCFMAWVEYNSVNKEIKNEFTYSKLKQYLSHEFIDFVIKNYFKE